MNYLLQHNTEGVQMEYSSIVQEILSCVTSFYEHHVVGWAPFLFVYYSRSTLSWSVKKKR